MKKITLLLLLFISASLLMNAQIVETMETSAPTPCDDIFVDDEGIIYTGKGGLSNKTNLGRITPDGTTTAVAQGMKGPISIVEAPNGLLYVTNYDDNSIKSYDRATEEVITVATGLDGPSGIAIDSTGVIYATNWGGAPQYSGHEIHRLFPDGTFEVFLSSPLFYRLQGIAFDDEGWLYVANTQNGRVFKINTATAEMQTLVTMNRNVVNMEFNNGYLYMASIQSDKIFRMNLDGEWTTFAGTGIPGGTDGPVETATFNNPIGVGFSPTGDTLYVSDTPTRIRRILLNPLSSTSQAFIDEIKIKVSPNPSSGIFEVDLGNKHYDNSQVKVVDVLGRLIFEDNVEQSRFTIDLSQAIPGSYFLVIQQDDASASVKLKVN